MMQRLYINEQIVDIDSGTAVGITLQGFDILDPGKLKTNISNDVSLPKTAKNLNSIGLNSLNFWAENKVYESITIRYYIENELIVNGQCYIKEVGDRIKLVLVTKPKVWDVLKSYYWIDFIKDYSDWLSINHSTFPNIINDLQTNERIKIMLYEGHLFGTKDNASNITINFAEGLAQRSGGYLFISIKWVFNFLSYKLQFHFDHEVLDGEDIWIPARSLAIGAVYNNLGAQTAFEVKYRAENFKEISENTKDKQNISIYNIIIAYCKANNYSIVFTNSSVLIRHFSGLKESSPYDLTPFMSTKLPIFTPILNAYSKANYIYYEKYYAGAIENENSIKLDCQNQNIPELTTLYTIDKTYFPKVNFFGTYLLMDLKNQDSFDNIVFAGFTVGTTVVNIRYSDNIGASHSQNFSIQQAKQPQPPNFDAYQAMILKPKIYTAWFYLGIDFFRNFDPLRQYYVRHLYGSYYVNKVDGFNPKSKDPVKLELIYSSAKLPPSPDVNIWVDGGGNPFVDGGVNQSIFY